MATPTSIPAGGRTHVGHIVNDLYASQRDTLLRHLVCLVSQRELAEDLCQETFLRAWSRWPSEGLPEYARAWLYRVATNLAYDELRRQQRRPEKALMDDVASTTAEQRLQQIEDQERMAQLLATLSPETAALLVEQFVHDCPMRELAERLECPLGTIKSRTSRARAMLRERLQREA